MYYDFIFIKISISRFSNFINFGSFETFSNAIYFTATILERSYLKKPIYLLF